MKKLLKHWIAKKSSTLHLAVGTGFAGMYLLGWLAGSSAGGSRFPGFLRLIGFMGLFATLLLALFHAGIYGSNRFLVHFRETSHLPARQLNQVCMFCMAFFLPASAALMVGSAMLLPKAAAAITSWFAARQTRVDPGAAASLLPDAGKLSQGQPAALPDIRPMPAWAGMLEELIFFFAYVMAVGIVLCFISRLTLRLYRGFCRAVQWDDDVRISLRPGMHVPGEGEETSGENPAPRRFKKPYGTSRPGEKVRRTYRRRIRHGLASAGHVGKNGLPLCPSSYAWATPTELESLASVDDPDLHQAYEKVRYGSGTCIDHEVLESIKH